MSIQVRLVTEDPNLVNHIEKLFKINYKNKCLLTHDHQAHVHIFDQASNAFDSAWNEYLNDHSRESAIILAESNNAPDAIKVNKPININRLWEAIMTSYRHHLSSDINTAEPPKTEKLARALESSFDNQLDSGNQNAAAPKGGQESHYDPQEYFEGFFHRVIATAKEQNKMLKTVGWREQYAAYDPKSNEVMTNLNTNQFKNMGIMKIGQGIEFQMQELKPEEYQMLLFDGKVRLLSCEQFLWHVAIHTCRGRLPKYVSEDTALSLLFWPNLSRMERPAHIMRVCSVLSEHTVTVKQLREYLGISPAEVNTCISAGLAIGAYEHDRQVESPQPFDVRSHEKRGLFRAILKRLAG